MEPTPQIEYSVAEPTTATNRRTSNRISTNTRTTTPPIHPTRCGDFMHSRTDWRCCASGGSMCLHFDLCPNRFIVAIIRREKRGAGEGTKPTFRFGSFRCCCFHAGHAPSRTPQRLLAFVWGSMQPAGQIPSPQNHRSEQSTANSVLISRTTSDSLSFVYSLLLSFRFTNLKTGSSTGDLLGSSRTKHKKRSTLTV